MKILHIAPTPFFANRGCHIRIRNEINGLLKRKVEVLVCTYGLGKDVEGIDSRRIMPIYGYRQLSAGFSPYKFLADFFLFFLVLKTTWKEKPDILHGHLHEGALLGWAVKKVLFWRKIPLLMDMQGSLSGELSAYGGFKSFPFILRLSFFLERIICSSPQKIVCSSKSCLEFLISKCGVPTEKSIVLIDAVPDSFFSPKHVIDVRQRYGIPTDKKIVIYTGSLLQGKGIDYLLGAMEILLTQKNNLFFVLVGYPKEGVAQWVRESGFMDSCLVVGEVCYDDLSSWLAIAQLAVDPKVEVSGEASGKILHYMACGLPVACFDTVNNRKYLNGNAFFAKLASAYDLARKIKKGLEEQENVATYVKNGRKIVKDIYSIEMVADTLITQYSDMIMSE